MSYPLPGGAQSTSRGLAEKLLTAFLGYEAIEGVLRRLFGDFSQEILIAKSFLLLTIYLFIIGTYRDRLLGIIEKFDRPFRLLLYLYASIIVIRVPRSGGSPYGALADCAAYLLCFPVFVVGYICAESSRDWSALWRSLRPLLYFVASYGLFQALTGFDTAAQSTGANDAVAAGGGAYRESVGGTQILTLASTLYGGRLGEFGAFWVIVSSNLVVVDIARRARVSLWSTGAVAAALVCLALGTNRTATLSTFAVGGLLFVYSILRLRSSRMIQMGLSAALLGAVLFLVFGLVLNRGSGLVQTSDITRFLGAAANSEEYNVVGSSSWNGLKGIWQSNGLWGAGTGTVSMVSDGTGGVFQDYGAEGIDLRLMYEVGPIGLATFAMLYFRLVYILLRRGSALVRTGPASALPFFFAAGVVVIYLSLAHKHQGFGLDTTFQTYVFAFVGSVLGSVKRPPVVMTLLSVPRARDFSLSDVGGDSR